jgi:hypothetical protein
MRDILSYPDGPEKTRALAKKIGDYQELVYQVDEYVQGGLAVWAK